ncbi:TPA: ABC transporter ATP-binding protein [Sulfurisphaera tokodaii]|uniref:ABC transporter ATP-binding protein n=1 Tax=Sulfurisphaera tokodaii TaxID=111955 RepID=A0A832T136_9CREN|nr:ABC transporter ATP-binding protein [Sulfurisphaera tokodaii]
MIVEISKVSKSLGGKRVLKGITLRAETKRLILLGHNGSGKTTLLAIILGLLKPDSGSVRLNGINPLERRDKILKLVSFAFEKPKFDVNFRVRDVYEFLKNYAESDCLELFWNEIELSKIKDSKILELSSGQTQLLHLMQAICRRSEIKVLDEPFSHLDYVRAGIIGDYLVKKGFQVIMTTHVPEEADWLADYVVILKDGELVWSGQFERLSEDGYYEVMVRGLYVPPGALAKVGNVYIVKSTQEDLEKLMQEGKILGYKRAGVRRHYEVY